MGIFFRFKRDKNWKRFKKMMESSHAQKIVKKHIRRATLLNGKVYEKHVRGVIKEAPFTPNAPLTEAIKKDNKPLVGVETGATLFKAITSKLMSGGSAFNDAVFIGVLRTNSFYNIAMTIHYGKTIPVTERMRGLFLMLAAASQGKISKDKLSKRGQDLFDYMNKGWKPLKKGTTRIVIPPREFITEAFKDSRPRKIAKQNWQQALQAAFAEIKASS